MRQDTKTSRRDYRLRGRHRRSGTDPKSDTAWEQRVGYSRAVAADGQIHVSGTTPVDDDGAVVGRGNPYEQTVRALDIVEDALTELDASLEDIVRTRLYVTDIEDWETIGRAHGEYFEAVRPATTMVEVSRLIRPEFLVEVEATAIATQ